MAVTVRSHLLEELLPAVRSGIRFVRLRPDFADDALQETLVALHPQIARLTSMSPTERAAYAFVAASRAAMAIRKRTGRQEASLAGADPQAPPVPEGAPSPESALRLSESAHRAHRALDALSADDRNMVDAVVERGLSEREVARELNVSRGSVAYRLRRAREALGRAWMGTTSWAHRRERR